MGTHCCSSNTKLKRNKADPPLAAPNKGANDATAGNQDAPSSSNASLKLEKAESRVRTPREDSPRAPRIPVYDITPRVTRSFKIYQVTGKQTIQMPYSRDSDWQQSLQVFTKMLNMTPYSTSLGSSLTQSSIRRQKQADIFSQLEQMQIQREIELMVSILNLKNRNWIQEQIRIQQKLTKAGSGSFARLVVTREFLQLREHFNWLIWAVSYYYFSMSRINAFFQYYQLKQIQDRKDEKNAARSKAQAQLFQEINNLLVQVNQLRSKLPVHISRKWTDGFNFMGVHFRMLPLNEARFVRNEMKALKYLQNELMELAQIQAQSEAAAESNLYKSLILPLLGATECGSFLLYASPVVYIQGFTEEPELPTVDFDSIKKDAANTGLPKSRSHLPGAEHGRTESQSNIRRQTVSLTQLYGSQIRAQAAKSSATSEKSVQDDMAYLQSRLLEIDDPVLKKMPLLARLTNENIIPIIDFEDKAATQMNFLIIHGFDCIPTVKYHQSGHDAQTAVVLLPSDSQKPCKVLDIAASQVSVAELMANFKSTDETVLERKASEATPAFPGQEQNAETDGDPRRIKARFFTKHGIDVLMLSQQTMPIQEAQDGIVAEEDQSARFQRDQAYFLQNKRAQVLFDSREDESVFVGMQKTTNTAEIGKLVVAINGEAQDKSSIYVSSIAQIQANREAQEKAQQVHASGGLVGPPIQPYRRKQSILRRIQAGGASTGLFTTGNLPQAALGNFQSLLTPEEPASDSQAPRGNVILVCQSASSDFKLKYPIINKTCDDPLELIYAHSVQKVAKTLESTDAYNTVEALKELMHRKGLNLRFQWAMLVKLRCQQQRELVMIHILVRCMKKIIAEEVKLKALIMTNAGAQRPGKQMQPAPKTLADLGKQQSGTQLICDQFDGANSDNFRDNLIFFCNTLLRRKFSKQKHVFDETLQGLFLSRLKVLPMINQMRRTLESLGLACFHEAELAYLESRQILEDIICAPSQNPALFMSTVQSYFHVELEPEFLRRCRQDKFLFLSKLSSAPMTMVNMPTAQLRPLNYYKIREFCYFMLASQIHQQEVEKAKDLLTAAQNGGGGGSVYGHGAGFDNVHDFFKRSSKPQNSLLEPPTHHDGDVNESQATEKQHGQLPPFNSTIISHGSALHTAQQKTLAPKGSLGNGTPRQFQNIDTFDKPTALQRQEPTLGDKSKPEPVTQTELVMPAVLYKMSTNHTTELLLTDKYRLYRKQVQERGEVSNVQAMLAVDREPETQLLATYPFPKAHNIFDTWLIYLETILKDVYAVEGAEQILMEALNFLALTIYFGDGVDATRMYRSSIASPLSDHRERTGSISSPGIDLAYDRDSFLKVCGKIKELQAVIVKCAPEVLIASQIICGLSFEEMSDESLFPIEAERSYLSALSGLFAINGDPRGRGNQSPPYMLLVSWKLGLLSLSMENRKVHDAEFSEELFDATLQNLLNHKTAFRRHQNRKLARIMRQQQAAEESLKTAPQKSYNSRRSAHDREGDFRHAAFEAMMDEEVRKKQMFDMSKFATRQPNQLEIMQMTPRSVVKARANNFQQLGPSEEESKGQTDYRTQAIGRIQKPLMSSAAIPSLPGAIDDERKQKLQALKTLKGPQLAASTITGTGHKQLELGSGLEKANLSDIELEMSEDFTEKAKKTRKVMPSALRDDGVIEAVLEDNDFSLINFSMDLVTLPEVPFVHWSIYKQSIESVIDMQGQKLKRQPKALNKLLCQLFKNTLATAIDRAILRPWMLKYNCGMRQSGLQWRNSQIKQALLFHTAQMISSSRSSSKSSQRNESEFLLGLSLQGSVLSSQGPQMSYRAAKAKHLGSYSSILNTENGSINKGDVQGVLYSWGSDAHGQLGHDSCAHLTQKSVKQKVLFPRMLSSLKDEFIKEICCGYAHTLAITMHGRVYSWGNNESSQLGLGPKAPMQVRRPALIAGLRNIIKLAAGNEHSVALSKNHEIYSWGSAYQTGQNDTVDRDTPGQIAALKSARVSAIACGGLHTLALTKDHHVFCWGSTEGGQLGLPMATLQQLGNNEENAIKTPQLLESLRGHDVIQIACGETHSLALCKDGKIYGWGTSMYGQLGLGFCQDSFEPGEGMQRSKVQEPTRIQTEQTQGFGEQIAKIFCGATFSLFLTYSGELYGCGMNDVGQLGQDVYNDISALESAKVGQMQISDITLPTQISSLQGRKIQTVACGEAHVLAIDVGEADEQRNLLFAWGQFNKGQLGLGEVHSKANPRLVQNLASSSIQKIACGSSHSLALIGDASSVTTLSPNFYAGSEMLANTWQSSGLLHE